MIDKLLLNKQELDEALSAENKYYFWRTYGREHKDVDELLNYYVVSGGCRDFIKRNQAGLNNKTQKIILDKEVV